MSPTTLPKYRQAKRKGLSASGIVRISYVVLILAGAAFAVFHILSA